MKQNNDATISQEPAGPSRLERLVNHGRSHGAAGLARRLIKVGKRTAMKYAALATYYPATGLDIARWKLRPRPTVLRTIDGRLRFESGRFAIFLVYQPKTTPWYVENALRALAKARTNVVLVFNHDLDAERLEFFQAHSCRILIRDNTGLDIGGYRDAYLTLRDEAQLQRLLFLNDSVYFFEEGLDALFERLMSSPDDVAAPYENHEFHWHLQSFCIAVSREALRARSVQQFFENYIPVNSRRWAIHFGEVALSKALAEAARSIAILYRAEDLATYRGTLPAAFADDPRLFIPIWACPEYDWRRQRLGGRTLPALATIADIARHRSQVHVAGFLFRALFGAPMMKRDLVYREQFHPDDVRRILQELGDEGHRDEILADLDRKGVGSELSGLDLGRYAAGMI